MQMGVARIFRVAEEGNASGQQFWPRGHDGEWCAFAHENNVVGIAGQFFIDHFGLGDGGLIDRIPQHGLQLAIDFALINQIKKRKLRQAARIIADGVVFLIPIHTQGDGLKQCTEFLPGFFGNAQTLGDKRFAA